MARVLDFYDFLKYNADHAPSEYAGWPTDAQTQYDQYKAQGSPPRDNPEIPAQEKQRLYNKANLAAQGMAGPEGQGNNSSGLLGGEGYIGLGKDVDTAAALATAYFGGSALLGSIGAGGSAAGLAETEALASTIGGASGLGMTASEAAAAGLSGSAVAGAGGSSLLSAGQQGWLNNLTGVTSGGVTAGLGGALTGAGGASGGSVWDQIAKAVGVTSAVGGAAKNIKDIIGGVVGGYGANEAANTYQDTMNQGMDKYTEAMKYAIDNSDPFKEQRPQYQSLLSDAMAGRLNSGNNSNYADVRSAAEGNPNMLNMNPVNNPAFMNTDPRANPNYMNMDATNNPWLADTNPETLMNSPLMRNLTETTLDNSARRLTAKYGGEVDSLGVRNEIAKQINAANAPLALDYYKTGLANNQQYLGTAANSNTSYQNNAIKYNTDYLNTASNNNNNYLRTAYGNNQDYTRNLATAAGANITPQTGQIAASYGGGLADLYGKMAPINAANTNSMYGNAGIAANGLYNLFSG